MSVDGEAAEMAVAVGNGFVIEKSEYVYVEAKKKGLQNHKKGYRPTKLSLHLQLVLYVEQTAVLPSTQTRSFRGRVLRDTLLAMLAQFELQVSLLQY